MKRTKRITNILIKHFPNFDIKVQDNSALHKNHGNFNGMNETHILIKLKLIKKLNFNLNRLEIHKIINSLVKEEFENGLHSLEIKINL